MNLKKKFLIPLVAAAMVLVGAGCTDYRMDADNGSAIKTCVESGGSAYAYHHNKVTCEFFNN